MILIISAHPDTNSLTAALAAAVSEHLRTAGCETVTVDLYQAGDGRPFPAVMDREELRRKTSFDPAVQRQMSLVEQADGYVVIHPDWWGGTPAVLKGWIDRVLRPGTAYETPEGFGLRNPMGLLEGRRALIACTGDADDAGPLENFWRERVWRFCGVESRLEYLPRIGESTAQERKVFIEKICSLSLDLMP